MALELALEKVLVFAPDLQTARQFYGSVLGLSLDREGKDHLEFSGRNFTLTVFSCERSAPHEGYSEQAGSSVAFSVASLDSAMLELSGRGVRFLHSIPNSGPSGRYVAFVDPFGTVHELVER